MSNIVNIMRKRENAIIPKRATEGSAGLDLFACIDNEIIINPGDIVKIPTGIAVELTCKDHVAMIFARSGLSINHGITLANSVGVIDSDFRGEIIVGLTNISKKPYILAPNERIAQLIVMPFLLSDLVEKCKLSETIRNESGLGSSGR